MPPSSFFLNDWFSFIISYNYMIVDWLNNRLEVESTYLFFLMKSEMKSDVNKLLYSINFQKLCQCMK